MLEERVGRLRRVPRRVARTAAVAVVGLLAALVTPVAAEPTELGLTSVEVTAAGGVAFVAGPETQILDPVVEYRELETVSPWDDTLSTSVVGGTPIPIDRHRYAVKLFAYDGPFVDAECGGVIIADDWVLTAAHCVDVHRYGDLWVVPDEIAIVYGVADWTDFHHDENSTLVMGESVAVHPDYDRETLAHDLALVRLAEPVDRSTADTIALFDLPGPNHGEAASVVGWGATVTGGPTVDQLHGVDVTIEDACDVWAETIDGWDDAERLCASAHPAGFCQGDSGGPLVVERSGVPMVAGIVSFNSRFGCGAHPDVPDVYTRMSAHVDWIESVTGPLWTRADVGTAGVADLPDARPGRTYAVRIGDGVTGAVTLATVTMPGRALRGPEETGVDCRHADPHPFVDVDPGSWADAAVACVFQLGITTGTSSSTYAPDTGVTREQMAAFLGRFHDTVVGVPCAATAPFGDVDPASYAASAIGCLATAGITTGTAPGVYAPDDGVTREQMAAFLARLWRHLTDDECLVPAAFVDVGPSSFARHDIGCLFELGVTTGTSTTTFSPHAPVTRAEMAVFLTRLYDALQG